MKRRLAGALLALALPSAAAPGAEDAICRAREFLVRTSADAKDGVDLGEQALVGLALVQAGLPPSDPLLETTYRRISGTCRSHRQVYELSMQLLFLDAMMHAPCGEAWPEAARAEEVRALVRIKASQLAAGCRDGAWGYLTEDVPGDRPDLSNTQCAVLALKAASLCGVCAPEASAGFWRNVLRRLLTEQRKGGWPYRAKEDATASMTAGAVAAMLVARSEAGALDAPTEGRIRDAARDGMAWLGAWWEREGPPVIVSGYLLYAMERAGQLSGEPRFGKRDWYAEGCRSLLASQAKEGCWLGRDTARVNTAFSVLFLCRGTRKAYAVPVQGPAP